MVEAPSDEIAPPKGTFTGWRALVVLLAPFVVGPFVLGALVGTTMYRQVEVWTLVAMVAVFLGAIVAFVLGGLTEALHARALSRAAMNIGTVGLGVAVILIVSMMFLGVDGEMTGWGIPTQPCSDSNPCDVGP